METKVEEIWKDVQGYEGHYQVSSLGRLKTLKLRSNTHEKGYLKSFTKKKGYQQYFLYKDDKRKIITAHRIVAIHFIPNPGNLPQVNHKDGNPKNNSVDNLEWITNLDNMRHSIEILGRKHNPASQESQKKTVYQLSFDGFLLNVFESFCEATRQTGIGHIDAVCRGDRKSAGGYKWSY